MDKSGYFKGYSRRLHHAACESKLFDTFAVVAGGLEDNDLNQSLAKEVEPYYMIQFRERERKRKAARQVNTSINAVESDIRKSVPGNSDAAKEEAVTPQRSSSTSLLYDLYVKAAPYPIDQYTAAFPTNFYDYLEEMNAYLGCGPIFYPNGINFNRYTTAIHRECSTKFFWVVCYADIFWWEPGQIEDFLLYLFNHHTFFGCIVCAKKSDFSRNKRRIAYTMHNSLAFFLVAFNVSLTTIGMPGSLAILNNIALITPATIAFNNFFQQLLLCTCLHQSNWLKEKHPGLLKFLEEAGLTIAFCMMLGGLAILLLATLFTTGQSSAGIIGTYFLQVQMYAFGLEFLSAISANFSFVYIRFATGHFFDLLNKIVPKSYQDSVAEIQKYLNFTVGARFIEKIVKNDLREHEHFVVFKPKSKIVAALHCILQIELLIERSFGEKMGWVVPITEKTEYQMREISLTSGQKQDASCSAVAEVFQNPMPNSGQKQYASCSAVAEVFQNPMPNSGQKQDASCSAVAEVFQNPMPHQVGGLEK